jgi:hypothetical protein
MKKYLWAGLTIGVCLVGPTASRASFYLGNGYLEMNLNGAGTTYNNVDSANGSTLFTISQGQSLYLGGQIRSYSYLGYLNNTVTMYYSLNGGSFTSVNLPYSNSGNDGSGSYSDQWDSGASVNIASLLTYGSDSSPDTDTLTVYFKGANGNGDTGYYNNSGYNFTFYITAVPEPINLALPLFGGLMLTAGLARRFVSKPSQVF